MELSDLLTSEAMAKLSPEKKLFLAHFFKQSQTTSKDDMLPFMLAALKGAEKKGLSFTKEESRLLIEILKQNMNEKELKNLDMILAFMNSNS